LARVLADAPPRAPWTDLPVRVLSAAVLVPVALVCAWVGHWPWIVLVSLATFGMAREWVLLCRHRPSILLLLAGLSYILLAVVAVVWLRRSGWENLLLVLLVVWATDIGAYLVGRLLGGPRLAPRISPGKTWSGAAGGFGCALAVGLGAASLGQSSPGPALAVAAGLSIAAQAGDLLESGMKRHFGVKDSGRLIPGHGGLLDRLDGLLAAAPVAALLAATLGRGVEFWR
jgi:phosphatidate cytidylyltransferase